MASRTPVRLGPLTLPVPAATARKLKKLRNDPGAFFYDLVAKRSGKPTRARLNIDATSTLRPHVLARGDGHLGDAVLSATEQLQGLGWMPQFPEPDDRAPLLVAYYPPAFVNPFQQLLYSEASSEGALAIPLSSLADLEKVRWPGHIVCHIHWLGEVLREAGNTQEAQVAIDGFAAQLDRIRAAGARIVWTVHNVLPHDARMPEKEIELRRVLIDRADAIHILTDTTLEETRAHYELPADKTFHAAHPSYHGAYPDFVGRQTARFAFGLKPGQTAIVFFGSIQPYKGLPALIDAMPESDDARLIIAGIASDLVHADAIRQRAITNPRIRLDLHRIPTSDVQYYMRAADYVVCPHRVSLNSGAAILAHDFGVPIIGPTMGAVGDLIARGGGIGFDPASEGSLANALDKALETDPRDFDASLAQLRSEHAREATSRKFFIGLRGKLL